MADVRKYDVVIIGTGTAGSNAGRAALDVLGTDARVAVVHQPDRVNTCVQEGCMPSKSLLDAVAACEPVTFETAMKRKDGHVERFKTALDAMLAKEGFDIAVGQASFRPGGAVEVHGSRSATLVGKRYVIATGSEPIIPYIPGLSEVPWEQILTSNDVVRARQRLGARPATLAVIGGGPIGLELATFFASTGTHVMLIVRRPLLPMLDLEFGKELAEMLRAAGIELFTETNIDRIAAGTHGAILTLTRGSDRFAREAEKILVATGRRPALEKLGLEHVGLSLENGKLAYDKATLQTHNLNVFVAGDVTGTNQILHYAAAQGRVAGYNAAVNSNSSKRMVDYEALQMGVIFTHEPIAYAGLTEEDARKRGIEPVVASVRFSEIGRGITMGCTHGLWKLIAERPTGRILGTQIIGPRADDLVHLVSGAMQYRATARDVRNMTWYHPTLAEIFSSLAKDLCKQLGQK